MCIPKDARRASLPGIRHGLRLDDPRRLPLRRKKRYTASFNVVFLKIHAGVLYGIHSLGLRAPAPSRDSRACGGENWGGDGVWNRWGDRAQARGRHARSWVFAAKARGRGAAEAGVG